MIEQFYGECRNGLWVKYDIILSLLRNRNISTQEIEEYSKSVPGFWTMTHKESIQYVERDRTRKIMELDLLIVFDYLSFAEGKIRLYIVNKLREKRNISINKSLQQLDQTWPEGIVKVPLEKVLDVFKKHGAPVEIVGNFKSALATRHWLAHGRWWKLKSGVPPKPENMKMRVQKLLEALKIEPLKKINI
ncbi:MAG: hypothetical protein HQL95_03080 [Magnetococcales bacterium]|nr:hypothetical protein [Magnetococcales bacterium]